MTLFTEAFRQVAKEHGQRIAISLDGKPLWTYEQLYHRALFVANELSDCGVKNEEIVAIAIKKSPEYIVAMLGTWFSGAAFLPLDPLLPNQRQQFLLKDANVKLVIAKSLCKWDDVLIWQWREGEAESGPKITVSPENLAYVIYSSGSTGRPKGIALEHKGICNLLYQQINAFALEETSRALFYLSTNFDAAISDIGTALLAGANLFLESNTILPDQLTSLLRLQKISHIDMPPSLLKVLPLHEFPDCLKTIIIGGEICPPAIVRQFSQRFRVVNVYGPTETTICTSLVVCDKETWTQPSIGQALDGVDYQVVAENGQLAQIGQSGELYISGIALARGYINQDALTAQKFIYWQNQRCYCTGDKILVTDTDLVFLGRIDRQIKINGVLIAPEEIEGQLLKHPDIHKAAVIEQQQSLVAFIEGEKLSRSQVRDHLEKLLSPWLLPNCYEFISLPITLTGKVDYQKLQALSKKQIREQQHGLTNEQRVLRQIWTQLLATDVSLEDDFFDLGGDSIKALQMVALAKAEGLNLNTCMLQSQRTIGNILAHLSYEHIDVLACDFLGREAQIADKFLSFAKERAENRQVSDQNILLTGATGFLGCHILWQLLEKSDSVIYCLVRGQNPEHCRERLLATMTKYFGHVSLVDRVVVVWGDIAQLYLGLPEEEWSKLSRNVGVIYHCAADVNLVAPYPELKQANVTGTYEILRLLTQGCYKCLHYASTLSVFVASDQNQGLLLESDDLCTTQNVYGGYAQTKWVSEVMLRKFSNYIPISFYRFGLLTGNSQTGYGPDDLLAMFVRGARQLGYLPQMTTDIALDITPIDYATKAMVSLASSGYFNTYHIANEQSLSFEQLVSYLQSFGVKLTLLEPKNFRKEIGLDSKKIEPTVAAALLALCRLDQASFHLGRTLDLFQASNVIFSTENSKKILSEFTCPLPSEKLLHRYFHHILS